MTTKEVISKLREDAKTRPALTDVLHMFAQRKRARHILTLDALVLKMTEEKFTYQREDYAEALNCLAVAGVGTLELDRHHKVKALKSIRYRIPQLGEAFFGGAAQVKEYKRPVQYETLAQIVSNPVALPTPRPTPKTPLKTPVQNVILTFVFNGKAMNIPLPSTMSPDDIAEFISRLREDSNEDTQRRGHSV